MRLRSSPLSEPVSGPAPYLRRAILSVYVPTLIAEIGIGATLPLFTLSALHFHEPEAVASLAVTFYALGRIGGAWVGGVATTRMGPIPSTLAGFAVLGVGSLLCAVAPGMVVLAAGVAILGAGHAAVHVARQAQLDLMVPLTARARGLTTLAGVWRIGNFVGPFVGAALIQAFALPAGYVLGAASVAVAAVVYAVVAPRDLVIPKASRTRVDVKAVLLPRARTLRTLGMGILMLGAVRQVRVVVIPLWAEHAGFSPAQASVMFGLATAVDMAMFIPAGIVMDKWGRFWTAVPSALALTIGFGALPFTHAAWTVAAASMLAGAGHGWGSGVVMTLGADAAPEQGRAVFLGVWTNLQDVGGLLGPLIVAAGAAVAVPVGVWAASGIGAGATATLWRWVPRRDFQ